MHIALLAFGFPLATCHILYSRIIFKIEYFYFLNRIDEWSFEKILGLHHVHNVLGFHTYHYPRANGAKRRSGRKPGARVTNFVLAELKVVARDR